MKPSFLEQKRVDQAMELAQLCTPAFVGGLEFGIDIGKQFKLPQSDAVSKRDYSNALEDAARARAEARQRGNAEWLSFGEGSAWVFGMMIGVEDGLGRQLENN